MRISIILGVLIAGICAPRTGKTEITLPPHGPKLSDTQSNTCKDQISRYGDGNGPSHIDTICKRGYFGAAARAASKQSDDGRVLVAGYGNMLLANVLEQKDPQGTLMRSRIRVYAGASTRLHEIRAVSLDVANREIAVFDGQSGEVLFFKLDLPGNVAPVRTLRVPELAGAVAVSVDSKHDELVVLNSARTGIAVFSRLANVEGRTAESRTEVRRRIRGTATRMLTPTGVALDPVHGEIFVSDSSASQVLVYAWDANGNKAPRRVIRGAVPGSPRR